MPERKREKKIREPNPTSRAGKVHETKIYGGEEENGKLLKDWSAEERFVNRSMRIRKKIRKWMKENAGNLFTSSSVMSDMAGNDCRCSSITAYRWLHQYSAPNEEFLISEQKAGLVIMERPIVSEKKREKNEGSVSEKEREKNEGSVSEKEREKNEGSEP